MVCIPKKTGINFSSSFFYHVYHISLASFYISHRIVPFYLATEQRPHRLPIHLAILIMSIFSRRQRVTSNTDKLLFRNTIVLLNPPKAPQNMQSMKSIQLAYSLCRKGKEYTGCSECRVCGRYVGLVGAIYLTSKQPSLQCLYAQEV